MVDFHARWSPPIQSSLGIRSRGRDRHAPPHLLSTERLHQCPDGNAFEGGKVFVLCFVGSHAIDTVCWLVETELSRVYGFSRGCVLAERGDRYAGLLLFHARVSKGRDGRYRELVDRA